MPSSSQSPGGPAAAMFEADLASRNIGVELLEAGDGTATARMTISRAMVNGHALAHGGYVFLLADTAFACACNSRGLVTVAADADITFVAPAREGDVLVAVAVERVTYGRSGIYDVTVRRGDQVVAEFRGRSRTTNRLAAFPGS
ncbi:MAG: hydroxyphenylacetyl-CoA thioesterase PaaI [Streptosporangiaceae bacterium]|jgi:acyl-CoA thioesterase